MPQTYPVYNQEHSEVGKVVLADSVFAAAPRTHIVHQVMTMYLRNRRAGTSAVKNKALVSGGGKKPWKQKHTGRARAGSIRSPLWKGGGTIFGPQPKDYSGRIPQKMRHEALRIALSDRAREGRLVVVDALSLPDGRTKSFCSLAGRMGWTGALIVGEHLEETVKRAARNVPGFKMVEWGDLSTYDVLKYPTLVLTKSALERLSERLA